MGREDPAREANLAWSDEGVPFAPDYDDVYYSRSGLEQGDLVFVQGSDLPARLGRGEAVTILETGLGLGVNLLAAVRALAEVGAGTLSHASIELHPLPPATMNEVHRRLGRGLPIVFVSFISTIYIIYLKSMLYLFQYHLQHNLH